MTSPSRSATEPIVALAAVPGRERHEHPRKPADALERPAPGHERRISIVAMTTSSTFPQVWATADPSGIAE